MKHHIARALLARTACTPLLAQAAPEAAHGLWLSAQKDGVVGARCAVRQRGLGPGRPHRRAAAGSSMPPAWC